ncbi:MAG: hypothetical protein ACYCZX_03900 [Rhodospirillaceae bacterium]
MDSNELRSVGIATLVAALGAPTLVWLASKAAPFKGKAIAISEKRKKINRFVHFASVVFLIGGAESVFWLLGVNSLPPEIRSAVLVISFGIFSCVAGTIILTFLLGDPGARLFIAGMEPESRISGQLIRRVAMSGLFLSAVLIFIYL